MGGPFMLRLWMRCVVAGIVLFSMTWASRAQSTTPQGAWLMKNYRFTGPPPPREVKPVDSVLIELRGIQTTIRTILNQAKFEGDYETALAAAQQLVANAQLIGTIADQQQEATQASQSTRPPAEDVQS